HSNGKSPVVGTSARSIKPRKAKPRETTTSSPTSPRGSGLAKRHPRFGIAKSWRSRTSSSLNARTSEDFQLMSKHLNITLKVWRQNGHGQAVQFETYTTGISEDASFLEMLDVVNEN